MSLSNVMQGVIGQNEFAKVAMLASGGEVECNPALTDDDRRDFEVHRRGHFGPALSIQVKTSLEVRVQSGRTSRLKIYMSVPRERLRTDPDFWYFFAHLDPRTARFQDPVFLVPSAEVHRHAAPKLVGQSWRFMFEGSMDPGCHDHWQPFQVRQKGLGRRLLALLRSQSPVAPNFTFEGGDHDGNQAPRSPR